MHPRMRTGTFSGLDFFPEKLEDNPDDEKVILGECSFFPFERPKKARKEVLQLNTTIIATRKTSKRIFCVLATWCQGTFFVWAPHIALISVIRRADGAARIFSCDK